MVGMDQNMEMRCYKCDRMRGVTSMTRSMSWAVDRRTTEVGVAKAMTSER